MSSGIRHVAAVIVVLFVALVAQLTYLQVADSGRLADDPHNARNFLRDLRRARGPIVTADDVEVARSVPSGDEYKRRRVYPPATARLFAPVVGFESLQLGSTGVEQRYSGWLSGASIHVSAKSLADVFANRDVTGTVVLTLSARAQLAAALALEGRRGSVVVLDVRTGGVVAMYSNPTYDPNLLATHDTAAAQKAFDALTKDPTNPMLGRAWRELYPPGSTFKTVTASIALQTGATDLTRTYPRLTQLGPLPLTRSTFLKNFGSPPETCGGDLLEGFVVSCNTTFAQIGLDLGDRLAANLPRFQINTGSPRSDLDPPIVGSTGPQPSTFKTHAPEFAQAAIGQNAVAVTPLEMALVAESVATGGVVLEPHVVDHVEDPNGSVVDTVGTAALGRDMDPQTAATLKDFMIQVVQRGTGTAAQIPGVQVAGKTGTAQTAPGEHPHAWFICFAPADQPRYAVAVLVEHGGNFGSEATGGKVAAPIAAKVLRVLLGR